MDMQSQKQFLKLASTLHFSKAAHECFITPSAMSRSIARMEEEIGFPLFERDNRSVRLTPAGEAFKKYAEKSVFEWERFRNSLSHRTGEIAGVLRMCSSVTASYTILDAIVSAFNKKHPRVTMQITTGGSEESIEKVLSGEADISIAIQPAKKFGNLVQRVIAVSPLRFVVSRKPLFDSGVLSSDPIDWNRVPFILQKEGETRKRVEAWCKARKIKPAVYAEVPGNEAAFALIRLGLGIGVVSDLFLDNNPQRKKVRVVAINPELEPYTIVLCAGRRGFVSPIIQAFWNETDTTVRQ